MPPAREQRQRNAGAAFATGHPTQEVYRTSLLSLKNVLQGAALVVLTWVGWGGLILRYPEGDLAAFLDTPPAKICPSLGQMSACEASRHLTVAGIQ